MGNQPSHRISHGKIVHYDGSVQEFNEPVTVAELMMDHPNQVVVEFNSTMNQKSPTPLPADKMLEMNKIYMMLPVKRGKPVALSVEDNRRILLIVNSALRSKFLVCSTGFVPWLVRVFQTQGGEIGRLKRKEEMESDEERFDFCEFLPEMMDGRPEYLSRQFSGKGWKPSLDTIKERTVKRKVSLLLFFRSFTHLEI